jgi:hypothetical protein
MNQFSNEELKKIYVECRTEITQEYSSDKDYLLTVYNRVFKRELGHLHYWMVKELLNEVEKEMALRFSQI